MTDLTDVSPVVRDLLIVGLEGVEILSDYSRSSVSLALADRGTLSLGDAAGILASVDSSNATSNAATVDGTPSCGILPPVTKTPDGPAPHSLEETLSTKLIAVTVSNEDLGDCSLGGSFPCTINDIRNFEAVELTVAGVAQCKRRT